MISSLRRGGRERQLCTIYKFNQTDVQEIKIVYFNESTPNYIDEFAIEADHLIKVRSKGKLQRIKEIRGILKKENPAVVFTWGPLEYLYSAMVRPSVGYVLINGSIRHGIISRKFSHYWRAFLLHLSRNIIANSQAGLRANGLSRGEVLYNGIDDKFFGGGPERVPSEFTNGALAGIVFVSVANLIPYKDYFTVIEAMARLHGEGAKFSYLVIGKGPMKEEIQAKINALNLEKNIFLLGPKDNVEAYLAQADVFVHSSKGEGCSNAILEAMASGLPVIASNVGGTPEIVQDGFGFLFTYKNVAELYQCLNFFLEDQERIASMGEKAKTAAHDNYSVMAMIRNYHEVINKILNRK